MTIEDPFTAPAGGGPVNLFTLSLSPLTDHASTPQAEVQEPVRRATRSHTRSAGIPPSTQATPQAPLAPPQKKKKGKSMQDPPPSAAASTPISAAAPTLPITATVQEKLDTYLSGPVSDILQSLSEPYDPSASPPPSPMKQLGNSG